MDLTIERSELLAAIDKCALAVPDPRHPTEAYRLMTVDATKKKKVRFAAVGEFCSVDTVGKAEMKEGGAFNAIPGHLYAVASAMPPGTIRLSMKGTRVTAQSLVAKRKTSFESHSLDVKPVDDPGKDAAWKELDAEELVKALGMAKHASTWIGRSDPIASLLIPTERGLDVFGCNMYLLALVETSIRIDGPPIIIPASAAAMLSLMAPIDAKVKIFTDPYRVYLENCDTLVSARLFEYPFLATHGSVRGYEHMLSLFQDTAVRGPTFSMDKLVAGVKSLHGLASFAGASERHEYGFQLRVTFGETVQVALDLAAAGGQDEFPIIDGGTEIQVGLESVLFEKVLASFAGAERLETQALLAVNEPTQMLILRSKGITYGIMTKEKR